MDEFALIDRFFKGQGVSRKDVLLGIGDDAAVVRPADGRDLVITTDVLVNGVHFPESTEPAAVGHKALAVNLSDIAAMGATPAWATMGLTLAETNEQWLEAFCTGFFALAEAFDVQLVGGDVTRGPLTIGVQLIGIVGEAGCLTRSGAREGDEIYVSGTLGDAGLGLQVDSGMLTVAERDEAVFLDRLNRPLPRVELGRALAGHATAAIDVSDGLVADLGHLCESSGVGAEVDVARVPISDSCRRYLAKVGWEPVLGFGDDYELCFTAAPDQASHIEGLSHELGLGIVRIGRIETGTIRWVHGDQPFSPHAQGYRHFR
jgi:thiamine-monophosphate kinase